MFKIRDIDDTYDLFVSEFRKKYLDSFPFVSSTDERFLIKNIVDLYRSKGSDESVKLLIKLLFNEEATVYYPGRDVLRASDSLWVTPKYIEVLSSSRSLSYVNQEVFGSVSGASAFVDAIVTKRTNNRLIDILYLSSVNGEFVFGDIITDDGILDGAPKSIGSLTEIDITTTTLDIGGNSLADKFDIVSDFGINGVVSVTGISDATTGIDFELIDGGYGYTLTDDTEIRITDLIVVRENANTVFEVGDIVTQKIEKIILDPDVGLSIHSAISVGDSLIGNFTDANTTPILGVVVDKGEEVIHNTVFLYLKIQVAEEETFLKNQIITLDADAQYQVGDTLKEESTWDLTLQSANGTFQVGELVIQQEFLANTANTVSSIYNFGTITEISNADIITITGSFGEFSANLSLTGMTSDAIGVIGEVAESAVGAEGTVIEKTSNTVYTVLATSGYSTNNLVRNAKNKAIATISSSNNVSVESIEINSLVVSDFAAEEAAFKGQILSQNDESLNIVTLENEFFYQEGTSILFDAAGNSITVGQIDAGSGAGFKIGSLTNTESVTLENEIIDETNVAGIPYTEILLNGQNSGIGYINAVTVTSGGTGYSNNSVVTFTGGGYLGQNPLIYAEGTVTTDGAGVITSINVIYGGEGYYEPPTITVSGGASAVLSANMTYGYGFPEDVYADANTIISTVLATEEYTIGVIGSITQNIPGEYYVRNPTVQIENSSISSYLKKDQILTIYSPTDIFLVGEVLVQANTSAKGIITTANTTSISVKNISFVEDFIVGEGAVSGETSTASAGLTNASYLLDNLEMGGNANITNEVNTKDGVVTSVKVIDSGYGYQTGENLTMVNGDIILQGITTVSKQGLSPGYWNSRTSHLNSEKRIHDNNYYQDYSYDVQSAINIDDYRSIVLDLIHVTGSKFFGSLVKSSVVDPEITSESEISQVAI